METFARAIDKTKDGNVNAFGKVFPAESLKLGRMLAKLSTWVRSAASAAGYQKTVSGSVPEGWGPTEPLKGAVEALKGFIPDHPVDMPLARVALSALLQTSIVEQAQKAGEALATIASELTSAAAWSHLPVDLASDATNLSTAIGALAADLRAGAGFRPLAVATALADPLLTALVGKNSEDAITAANELVVDLVPTAAEAWRPQSELLHAELKALEEAAAEALKDKVAGVKVLVGALDTALHVTHVVARRPRPATKKRKVEEDADGDEGGEDEEEAKPTTAKKRKAKEEGTEPKTAAKARRPAKKESPAADAPEDAGAPEEEEDAEERKKEKRQRVRVKKEVIEELQRLLDKLEASEGKSGREVENACSALASYIETKHSLREHVITHVNAPRVLLSLLSSENIRMREPAGRVLKVISSETKSGLSDAKTGDEIAALLCPRLRVSPSDATRHGAFNTRSWEQALHVLAHALDQADATLIPKILSEMRKAGVLDLEWLTNDLAHRSPAEQHAILHLVTAYIQRIELKEKEQQGTQLLNSIAAFLLNAELRLDDEGDDEMEDDDEEDGGGKKNTMLSRVQAAKELDEARHWAVFGLVYLLEVEDAASYIVDKGLLKVLLDEMQSSRGTVTRRGAGVVLDNVFTRLRERTREEHEAFLKGCCRLMADNDKLSNGMAVQIMANLCDDETDPSNVRLIADWLMTSKFDLRKALLKVLGDASNRLAQGFAADILAASTTVDWDAPRVATLQDTLWSVYKKPLVALTQVKDGEHKEDLMLSSIGVIVNLVEKNDKIQAEVLADLTDGSVAATLVDQVYNEKANLGLRIACLHCIGNLSSCSTRHYVRALYKFREVYETPEKTFIAKALRILESIENGYDMANIAEGFFNLMDFKRNRILLRRVEGGARLERLLKDKAAQFEEAKQRGTEALSLLTAALQKLNDTAEADLGGKGE